MSNHPRRMGGQPGPPVSVPARRRASTFDRAAWRRFFLALLGLGAALFAALLATALRQEGQFTLAAVVATLSLILTGLVAVKVVPALARRTVLRRWMGKWENELTTEGVIYLFLVVAIIVAALNTGNNLLFIILSCLLAGVVASGLVSRVVLSGLELELPLPDHLFAEQPAASRLTLRNLKRFLPSFSVTVSAPKPSGTKESSLKAAASNRRAGRRGPSREVASAAVIGIAATGHPILNQTVYVPYVPRRSSITQAVELKFARRGRYTQGGFRISTKFPFGLLRKARELPAHQEIIVLPNVQPTEEFYEILPLISGELESAFKGRGHDLYAIRDYQQSDSARHVDWKATAKARQVKVREFTREDERRVTLVFDKCLGEPSPNARAKFEKAVNFCACLAWHFYEIDAQMQFLTEDYETPMTLAADVIYPVLERLALIEPEFGSVADGLLARVSSQPGFNIILTCRARGSLPTSLWASSYVVFMDSL